MRSDCLQGWLIVGAILAAPLVAHAQEAKSFHLVEATIDDIHNAIKTQQISCRGLVQAYINRAAAYNGVCTQLVTADGAPIPPARGPVRVVSPLTFPTDTVPISSVLPNFNQYTGLPIDLGRMEATVSDPAVQQQFGMRTGIPNAGQVNALETINIRGRRSVTCKGAFDAHPSSGPLPKGAPPECEAFRQQPDALEQAAELDRRYGSSPPLDQLPVYCIPVAFKSWYDAKDMRATGGNDVNFAMDAPPRDSNVVAQLREKGAIVYAIANAAEVSLTDSGPAKPTRSFPTSVHEFGTWGGQPCNPYDTEREPRGSSSGSGVSVAANLVVCAICEQGFASCKGPASRNNVVNLLTTKGVMTDGGIHSQRIHERAGIHCRTVRDAARVLDAVKGYTSRDYFTAIPKMLIPEKPYASFVVDENAATSKPLAGVRLGVVREFMVKHAKNDAAISDQLDKEIKVVLRDRLGAELVESVDPLYPDDPAIPNMKYTFQDAFAEILAFNVPEYFFQAKAGALEFAVPGFDVRTMDYMIKLALGKAPLSNELNLRRIAAGLDNTEARQFSFSKYLIERGDKRITNWASFVANAKWKNDVLRAGAENAVGVTDLRATSGIDRIKMQTVVRLVILKVMYENNLDGFVNPENTLPPRKLFGPSDPVVMGRDPQSCCGTFTPFLGIPEIDVPAGYNQIVYEPQYVLSADKKSYTEVSGTVRSLLPVPMPNSLMFWAGPGGEPMLLKIASAYEAATKHRVSPTGFGALSGEP